MLEQLMDHDKASALFNTLAYSKDDGLFVNQNFTLGFGFVCTPLTGADETIENRIKTLVNDEWPTNTILSFSLFTNSDIHLYTNDFMNMRAGVRDPLFEDIADNRQIFLQHAAHEGIHANKTKLRDIVVIISAQIPMAGEEPTEEEIADTKELRTTCQKSIEDIYMGPQPLNRRGYLKIMRNILNQGTESGWNDNLSTTVDEDRTLNEQILDTTSAIEVTEKYLKIGSKYVSTMSVKKYPDSIYMNLAASYLGDFMTGQRGIRETTMITMSIYYPESLRTKSTLDKKRTFIVNQAYGPLLRFVPILGDKKKSFDILDQSIKEGNRPLRAYMSVVQFSNSPEELKRSVTAVRSYLSELGFQIQADLYFNLPLFINSLPMSADYNCVRDTFRYKTLTAKEIVPLLPIIGEWKGTGSAKMNFIGRMGQIMTIDNFDSDTNYNVVIAAESGAGKSFLTNYIITNTLSTGGLVWVIDVGRSYLNICETYGGEFIHFGEGSNICLNPFEIVKDWNSESDMLTGLMIAMAAPTEPLHDQQVAVLKRHMTELWAEKGNKLSITDIAKRCLESKDQRIRDVGDQLYDFTEDGPHGQFFNGTNNVKFENRFTVLELDDLQGRGQLQTVVLLQLIYQIQQKMYFGSMEQDKKVIIDEAWSLLSEGAVAKFIEHGYRRFRKYRGAAFTITQSMFDLKGDRTGEAILQNSSNKWLLSQTSSSIDGLRKEEALETNDTGYEILKTVHTSKGNYSEIFFITPMGQGVGKLVVDPFQILLYSTDHKDRNAIKAYTDQNYPVADAIKQILIDRGTPYGSKGPWGESREDVTEIDWKASA